MGHTIGAIGILSPEIRSQVDKHMRRFAKVLMGVSAALLIIFALALLLGAVSSFNSFNNPLCLYGLALSVFVVGVAALVGLVLCGVRRDWRSAVFLLIAEGITLAIPLVYLVLLFGSFA